MITGVGLLLLVPDSECNMRPTGIRLAEIVCVLDGDIRMIGKPGIHFRLKSLEFWLPVA